MRPVAGVEPAERGVDGGGQRPAGGFREPPEQGDAEQLTFPGGEVLGAQGRSWPGVELEGEGLWVDGEVRDQ